MGWIRARRPAQKEERREALLAAAVRLFEKKGLEKTSLSALACAAGITKASVYRYFGSKEEIFLAVYAADQEEWTAAAEAALAALGGEGTPQTVAEALVKTLAARPRLMALTAALSGILERNISVEAAAVSKTKALGLVLRFGNALVAALPGLTLAQARDLSLFVHVQIAGLWPLANPADTVRQVLERPEYAAFRFDFAAALTDAVRCQIRGILTPPC